MVVCVTEMPRSAIMITRSRKLSLKLVYQLTHKTMICRSKCRPLNRSSIGTNRCISSSSSATLAFAPEPKDGQLRTTLLEPFELLRHSNQQTSNGTNGIGGQEQESEIWLPTLDTFRTFLSSSDPNHPNPLNCLSSAASECGGRGIHA